MKRKTIGYFLKLATSQISSLSTKEVICRLLENASSAGS